MGRREFKKQTKRDALKRSGGLCEAVGCCNAVFRRSLCSKHYSRLIRYGDIETVKKQAGGTGLKWLEEHVTFEGDECLTFPFNRNSNGYGRVTIQGRRAGAHRAMCFLVHGAPPDEKHEAAHSCGNGHLGCVNPQHLRWATRSSNLADRIIHGGGNRGELHGLAKLDAEAVREIRKEISRGETQADIADRFGIQQSTVSKIFRGERWGWLDDQA